MKNQPPRATVDTTSDDEIDLPDWWPTHLFRLINLSDSEHRSRQEGWDHSVFPDIVEVEPDLFRLQSICKSLFDGTDFATWPNTCVLRAIVCYELDCTISEADELPIKEVADACEAWINRSTLISANEIKEQFLLHGVAARGFPDPRVLIKSMKDAKRLVMDGNRVPIINEFEKLTPSQQKLVAFVQGQNGRCSLRDAMRLFEKSIASERERRSFVTSIRRTATGLLDNYPDYWLEYDQRTKEITLHRIGDN